MVTIDQLIEQITPSIGKTKVLSLCKVLRENEFDLSDLVNLTFHNDRGIGFRAAWVLENLFLSSPIYYLEDIAYLLSKIKNIENPACKRHYAKIILNLTDKKAPAAIKKLIEKLDLEPVVEQCFDWAIDPEVKIAVKVFALESLYNLSNRYIWIRHELANQIQFLMRNGSPGIQSKGNKLLKLLANNQ